VLLNINANFIPDEGIDEVKEILKGGKNSLDVLGPLDENDPEGDPEDDDEEDGDDDADDEEKDGNDNGDSGLGSKMQDLKVEED
jgi:Ran GTPase-activating protein 1